MRRSMRGGREQGGFTLTEFLVVLAVAGISSMVAWSSWAGVRDGRALAGAAEGLRADLAWARALAISEERDVFVIFRPGPDWCYVLTTDPGCRCAEGCAQPAAQLRLVTHRDAGAAWMLAAATAGGFCGGEACVRFQRLRGTAFGANGSLTLSRGSAQVQVILAATGRLRACRSSGSGAGNSLPACA